MGNKLKLFKILQNAAIIVLFLVAGIAVLGVTEVIGLSKTVIEILIILGILCISCLMALPWAKKLEKPELKIISWVFVGLIAFCSVLSIVSVILLFGITDEATAAYRNGTLITVRTCAFTLIQLSTATLIASTIIKYQKSNLLLQIITYIAHLYVDFYVSFFVLCMYMNERTNLEFSEALSFLGKKPVYVIAILMFVYVLISRFVLKSVDKRHVKEIVENSIREENAKQEKPEKESEVKDSTNSVKQKLEELKKLYNDELITEKEYEEKRAEILKQM